MQGGGSTIEYPSWVDTDNPHQREAYQQLNTETKAGGRSGIGETTQADVIRSLIDGMRRPERATAWLSVESQLWDDGPRAEIIQLLEDKAKECHQRENPRIERVPPDYDPNQTDEADADDAEADTTDEDTDDRDDDENESETDSVEQEAEEVTDVQGIISEERESDYARTASTTTSDEQKSGPNGTLGDWA